MLCSSCKTVHECKRCAKNMHICSVCGKMTHECDICGVMLDSISSIKKHQKLSKICKKTRTMTVRSLKEQMEKLKMHIVQPRRKSVVN